MSRTTGKHELDRFLLHLARTGNFALAAEWTGRAKSGLYKRKARDPAFAARCQAALAAFRLRAKDFAHPEGPLLKLQPVAQKALRTTAGTLILSRTSRRSPVQIRAADCVRRPRVQIRRSPAGRLTRHGLETFLRALAATANIRLAAHSVGIAASSIHWRCHADPAFAREVDAALDVASARLEAGFIEACEATFDPEGEHLNWLEDGCMQPIWDRGAQPVRRTGENRDGAQPVRDRDAQPVPRTGEHRDGENPRDGEQGDADPPLPRITVDQAICFLEMHDRRKRRR